MSYMTVPTMRVMREDGKGDHIINVSDYDPERHVLPEATEATEAPARRGRKPRGEE